MAELESLGMILRRTVSHIRREEVEAIPPAEPECPRCSGYGFLAGPDGLAV